MSGCFGCFKKTYRAPDCDVLDYRNKSLQEVPPDVFQHERTLEYLILSSNQIADLPPSLFHCHELRELDLNDNDLVSIPAAIGQLTRLTRLDLSRNAIGEISDSIKQCKNLIYLDLSFNHLTKVPEAISHLVNLEALILNDIYLEFVHANFGRLTKLRYLELRENQLQALPKSLTRLNHLTRLDLGQNDLGDMPEVIGSMTYLIELWLDGNALRCIPKFIGNLIKLNCLDVANNELSEIADEICKCSHLTDITLNNNNLDCLPDSFPKLESLSVLRLESNQIQYLPEDFGNLKNLQELNLKRNLLKALPPSIGLLRKLHTLYLDDNLLTTLPKELGSCSSLSILHVAMNRLTELPSELGHLSRLKVLALAGNLLVHLPVTLLNITSLGAVWLSESQSKPLLQFNKEIDSVTGQPVLTCFLLPQLPLVNPVKTGMEETEDEPEKVTRRSRPSIKFTDQEATILDSNMKKGLLRAPTPYPKELRALAKHASHLRQHKDQNGDTANTDEPEYEGDYAEDDDVHLHGSVPDGNDGLTTGLRMRTGGLLDISGIDSDRDIDKPGIKQSDYLNKGDNDKTSGEVKEYRYRHPFHANYQQDVMEENRARLQAESLKHEVSTSYRTSDPKTQSTSEVKKDLDVGTILGRIDGMNKQSMDNGMSNIRHSGNEPEHSSLFDNTKLPETPSANSTTESGKLYPPPYEIAARRAAFFRTPSVDQSPSVLSTSSTDGTNTNLLARTRIITQTTVTYTGTPSLPGLYSSSAYTPLSSYNPCLVPPRSPCMGIPGLIAQNRFYKKHLTSTSVSNSVAKPDLNSTFTIENDTSACEEEVPFVNVNEKQEQDNKSEDLQLALQNRTVESDGIDGRDLEEQTPEFVDSTKPKLNETYDMIFDMTSVSNNDIIPQSPLSVGTGSPAFAGITSKARQDTSQEFPDNHSSPLDNDFPRPLSSTEDNKRSSFVSDNYVSPSESTSKIPVLGSNTSGKPSSINVNSESLNKIQFQNSFESKLRPPSSQPSVLAKTYENVDIPLRKDVPEQSGNKIGTSNSTVLSSSLSSSRIPKFPSSYTNSSSKLLSNPSVRTSVTLASNVTSNSSLKTNPSESEKGTNNENNSRIPSSSVRSLTTKQSNNTGTLTSNPSIGESSKFTSSEGKHSQYQPSLVSSNIITLGTQTTTVATQSVSESKIPSLTNTSNSLLKRTGSGSRIPMKKVASTEDDPTIKTAPPLPTSKIPSLGSTTRKPWIFGAHKNPIVVALDYKKINDLGFSICNGVPSDVSNDQNGVYIDHVDSQENSTVKIGDKLLEVDGIDIANMTIEIVRKVLSNCQENINLLVSRQS